LARIVHDALEVVGCMAHPDIIRTVVSRAGVGASFWDVLRSPVALHVLPVDLQMGTIAMILLRTIHALLRVMHTQGVANLVNNVAPLPHAVAPSQVHLAGLRAANCGRATT